MEVETFGDDEIGPYKEDPDPPVIPDDVLRECVSFFNEGSFLID
jgi:hypothetical protein